MSGNESEIRVVGVCLNMMANKTVEAVMSMSENDYVLALAVLAEVKRRLEAVHRVEMVNKLSKSSNPKED